MGISDFYKLKVSIDDKLNVAETKGQMFEEKQTMAENYWSKCIFP